VLQPAGPDSFETSAVGTLHRCAVSYRFPTSRSGLGFETTRPAGPGGVIRASYLRMPASTSPALSAYRGEYVSEELATSWCPLRVGAGLLVRRRGFAERPLQTLWKDAAAGPRGIPEFQRGEAAVTGFRLPNPRINGISLHKLAAGKDPVQKP
jgi:hypothetical protein